MVVKALVVRGVCASLYGRDTDGAATLEEQALPAGVSAGAPEARLEVQARASDAWPLNVSWAPRTKSGGELVDPVDSSQVEKLELVRSYVTMPGVQEAVKTFHTTWFYAHFVADPDPSIRRNACDHRPCAADSENVLYPHPE